MRKAILFLAVVACTVVAVAAGDRVELGREYSSNGITYEVWGLAMRGVPLPFARPGCDLVQVWIRHSDPTVSAFRVTLVTASGEQRAIVEPMAQRGRWDALAVFWVADRDIKLARIEALKAVASTAQE